MTAPTVLLMLKAPVEGQVKTRLGREMGMAAATLIYRRLVEHQMQQIPSGWPAHVCFAPVDAESTMRAWLGQRCTYLPQSDGDLGNRLASAAARHFHHEASPLMIIGGDCPSLTCDVLIRVASVLVEFDVVVVPAIDGGYCLIAMRALVADLFRDITWSTASVLEETCARLAASGVTWQELSPLEDVDDQASWQRAVAAFPPLDVGRSPVAQ